MFKQIVRVYVAMLLKIFRNQNGDHEDPCDDDEAEDVDEGNGLGDLGRWG